MIAEIGTKGDNMDHAKTIIEKLTDAVKGAAHSIVDAASNAAEPGIKSNAARMSPSDQRVAGTANEQIFIPEATDAAAMPVPFAVATAARKARKSASKKAKSGTGRKAVTRKKSFAKKNKANKSRR
jgi:hypothetical protein